MLCTPKERDLKSGIFLKCHIVFRGPRDVTSSNGGQLEECDEFALNKAFLLGNLVV